MGGGETPVSQRRWRTVVGHSWLEFSALLAGKILNLFPTRGSDAVSEVMSPVCPRCTLRCHTVLHECVQLWRVKESNKDFTGVDRSRM